MSISGNKCTWSEEWSRCNEAVMAYAYFDFCLKNSHSGSGQFKMICKNNLGSAKALLNALEEIGLDEGGFYPCMGIRHPFICGNIVDSSIDHSVIVAQTYVSMGVDFVYPCPPFSNPSQIFET